MGQDGGRDFGWCNLIIKFLLFFTNIVLWLLGGAVLAIGIYIQVESTLSDLGLKDALTSPSIILIIIGGVLFLIGFCGCFGALLELWPILVLYSVVLGIIVVLEIAVVVVVYLQRTQTRDIVESALTPSIVRYYEDVNVRDIIDFLQRDLFCCGLTQPEDWIELNAYFNCSTDDENKAIFTRCSVPFSCCSNVSASEVVNFQCGYGTLDEEVMENYRQGIYTTGCISSAEGFLLENIYIIGGIGIALLILQIINVFLASGLAVDSYRERKLLAATKKQKKLEERAQRQ